ncbi:IclR family transcriptional regulator [Mycobacterium sp. NAZ190054]|uniref:IclR family transcriptional regulator n=1 Tax=Mycobacterium sp. NAZ190054 TaxID=1747766 RepID=UPI0009EB6F41|nr:IclR family transcriptional regulator [Mycobacterium sp. NAZ190054]
MSAETKGAKSVEALKRIVAILDCFSPATPRLRAIDIHRATGLPTSTVGRTLRNLVDENVLERHGDEYNIGLRVAKWRAAAGVGSDLVSNARPRIESLRDRTNETCDVYVRSGMMRILVLQAQSTHSLLYRAHEGQALPLSSGASGKVFMAYDASIRQQVVAEGLPQFSPKSITDLDQLDRELETVRSRGWSYAEEEYALGLNAVAAPILGANGEIVGVVAIGIPSVRFPRERSKELGELTAECAESISQRLAN